MHSLNVTQSMVATQYYMLREGSPRIHLRQPLFIADCVLFMCTQEGDGSNRMYCVMYSTNVNGVLLTTERENGRERERAKENRWSLMKKK